LSIVTNEPRRREWQIAIAPKTLVLVASALAALWLAHALLPVLLVIVAAAMLAGTLAPAVHWLEAHRIKRGIAIAIVFTTLTLGMTLFIVFTVPALVSQIASVIVQEPQIRERAAVFLGEHRITASLAAPLRAMRYGELVAGYGSEALAFSTRAVEVATYLVATAFLSLYMMIGRDRLRGGLFALVPRRYHLRLSRVLINLQTIVGGYIRGQLLTSAFMAVFAFVLLTAFGIDNALALALFAGLTDVLPYVGGALATIPIVAAASSHGLVIFGIVLAAMLVYQEIESRFIVPRVYGDALRLPPSIVLIALLVGGALLGIVGALLALPVAAALRMLVEELRVALPGEDFDDTVIRERDESAEDEYARRAEGVPAKEAVHIAVEISEQMIQEQGGPEQAASVPITGGHPD
jgi:putative heme transporter